MPLINVKLLRDDSLSPQKKAELIKRLTETVADTLGKNPASTWVTIEEVEAENWGVGGKPLG